jgi:phosphohistidine phosphatase
VEGGACGENVQYDQGVYLGGARGLLEVVRESAGEAQVVLVVGHNPTLAMLASSLSEGDGSMQAHECLAAGFPTSTVAVLRYAGPWSGLEFGTAWLDRCHTSRG